MDRVIGLLVVLWRFKFYFLCLFGFSLNCMYSIVESPLLPPSSDSRFHFKITPGKIYFGGIYKDSNAAGSLKYYAQGMEYYQTLQRIKDLLEDRIIHLSDDSKAKNAMEVSISIFVRPTIEFFECVGGAVGDPLHPMYLPRISYSFCFSEVAVLLNFLTLGIVPAKAKGMMEVEYNVFFKNRHYSYSYFPKYEAYRGIYYLIQKRENTSYLADGLYLRIYDPLANGTISNFLLDLEKDRKAGRFDFD